MIKPIVPNIIPELMIINIMINKNIWKIHKHIIK